MRKTKAFNRLFTFCKLPDAALKAHSHLLRGGYATIFKPM